MTAQMKMKPLQQMELTLDFKTIAIIETVVVAEREVPVANEKHVKADIHSAKKVLTKLLALRDNTDECSAKEIVKTIEI